MPLLLLVMPCNGSTLFSSASCTAELILDLLHVIYPSFISVLVRSAPKLVNFLLTIPCTIMVTLKAIAELQIDCHQIERRKQTGQTWVYFKLKEKNTHVKYLSIAIDNKMGANSKLSKLINPANYYILLFIHGIRIVYKLIHDLIV